MISPSASGMDEYTALRLIDWLSRYRKAESKKKADIRQEAEAHYAAAFSSNQRVMVTVASGHLDDDVPLEMVRREMTLAVNERRAFSMRP